MIVFPDGGSGGDRVVVVVWRSTWRRWRIWGGYLRVPLVGLIIFAAAAVGVVVLVLVVVVFAMVVMHNQLVDFTS